MIVTYALAGASLAILNLEAMACVAIDLPPIRGWLRKRKEAIRHWWWMNFNWRDDYVSKD